MTRILLLGATGQVGWELARSLQPQGTVVVPDRATYDLAKPRTLAAVVDDVTPAIIVNAAAYTAVDEAEKNPALAMTINADGPAELALRARRLGALLIHYSTDYVFDGGQAHPYSEDDQTAPIQVYGSSKLRGEEAVRASGADHLIFRTSWVYSARGRNFVKTILRLAAERDELRIVSDQVGAPTWARLIADVTALALRQDLATRATSRFQSGTFHLTAAGETSWHGLASAIVAFAREREETLKCRSVVPISTDEYPLPAARPPSSRLSGRRLSERYRLSMPAWDRCLQLCLDDIFVFGAR